MEYHHHHQYSRDYMQQSPPRRRSLPPSPVPASSPHHQHRHHHHHHHHHQQQYPGNIPAGSSQYTHLTHCFLHIRILHLLTTHPVVLCCAVKFRMCVRYMCLAYLDAIFRSCCMVRSYKVLFRVVVYNRMSRCSV